ncbi:hypothetical protein B0H34DRAFT_683127 [Crassisporium funariophilum]|nr:hypothetical protein B0H34DRAFT_683127 [Crassisporium funariophilum]
MKFPQNIAKPSLKRHADILDVADERQSKNRRVTSPDGNDMDWLKCEISDMKERVKEISEHLGGDTDYRLEEYWVCTRIG